MDNLELEHAAKIERLLQMSSNEVENSRIKGLIDGIYNHELTEEDVLQFTNITAEQLQILMIKRQ